MKFKGFFPSPLVGLLAILTACGPVPPGYYDRNQTPNRPTDLPKVDVTASTLQGTWTSECWSDPAAPAFRYREVLTFIGNSMTAYQHVYIDGSCLVEHHSRLFSGVYSMGGSGSLSENLTYVTVTAAQQTASEGFNQNRFCGKGDWYAQVPQNFSDVAICGYAKTRSAVIENYGQKQLYITASGAKQAVKYIR